MSGVHVVAFVVQCSKSLLLCQDVATDHLRFADPDECRERLPALIRAAQRQGHPENVVMGRCRFVLQRPELMPPE